MTDENRSLIVQKARQQALAEVKQFETSLLNSVAPEKKLHHTITCAPVASIQKLAFSPDGRILAAAYWEKYILLWDVETGKCFQVFRHQHGYFNSIAFTPDGDTLLSCNGSGIQRWDLNTGKCVREYSGHTSDVNDIVVGPDGKYFFSIGYDNKLRQWNFETGECQGVFASGSHALAITSDASRFFSTGRENAICLSDLQTGSLLRQFHGHTDTVNKLAITPDGQTIISGSNDRSIRVWDIHTGRCLRVLKGHTYHLRSLDISPDGQFLLSSATDDSTRLWDIHSGACLRMLSKRHPAVFHPDGNSFAAAGYGFIEFHDQNSYLPIRTVKHHTSHARSMTLTPDGQTLVSGGYDGDIRLWDQKSGHLVHALTGHSGSVKTLAVSPCGKTIVSGSEDKTVRVWDRASGRCLQVLRGHERGLWSVLVHPDGERVVSSDMETIRLWEIKTGRLLRLFTHSGEPEQNGGHLSLSRDGSTLISVCSKGTRLAMYGDPTRINAICIWDVQTGHCLNHFRPWDDLCSVAICPEGDSYLVGSYKKIVIHNLNETKSLQTMQAHNDRIDAITFHPNGSTFVSGDREGKIGLWNLATAECLRSFSGHSQDINALCFTQDGKVLISGSDDDTLHFWDCETTELLGSAYNVDDGYLWITPPDEFAGNGWLHTNRPDLVSLTAVDTTDANRIEYLREEDERFTNYMKLYNDGEMVMNRIFNRERYKELLRIRMGLKNETVARLNEGDSKLHLLPKPSGCPVDTEGDER